MSSKRLEQAAQHFCEAETWKALKVNELFAICGWDEKVRYVVVGRMGEDCQVLLFEDMQGMTGYAELLEQEKKGASAERMECQYLELDGLAFRVAFREKEYNLCRYEYARFPRELAEEEEERMADALLAATQLAALREEGDWKPNTAVLTAQSMPPQKLPCARILPGGERAGWSEMELPEDIQVSYPALALQNELALARLRKQPSTDAVLSCVIRVLPLKIEDMENHCPIAMMMLDDRHGVLGVPVVGDFEQGAMRFASEFLGYIEEFGRPASLRVSDMRAYCLLNDLSEQMGIRVIREIEIPEAEQAFQEFIRYMKSMGEGEEKENKPDHRPKKIQGSRGICMACEREFASGSMARHLKSCYISRLGAGETLYYLIRVCAADDPAYWMYLDVKSDASLRQLDRFLRDTWVECCGHMSAFTIRGKEYVSVCEAGSDAYSMNARLNEVVAAGTKFKYEYDFGTPTELTLQVVEVYQAKDRRKKIELAARNVQPQYACVRCGKPAQVLQREAFQPIAECAFCRECAEKEGSGDFARPILNSPRAGLCGYGCWMDDE